MKVGIYAGSYNPFTYGHLSVVEGALRVFDHVIIAIGHNPAKKGLFTPEQRESMIRTYLEHASSESDLYTGHNFGKPRVSVEIFQGLLSDFAKNHNGTIVRGLRALNDFETEMSIADANRKQAPGVQTIFIPAEGPFAYVSSSVVKELAGYPGSDISHYVNDETATALRKALKS